MREGKYAQYSRVRRDVQFAECVFRNERLCRFPHALPRSLAKEPEMRLEIALGKESIRELL